MLIELRKKLATFIYGNLIDEYKEETIKANDKFYSQKGVTRREKEKNTDYTKTITEQIEAYNTLEDKYLTLSCKTSKTIVSLEQKILAANSIALLSIREKDYNHKTYSKVTKIVETVSKKGIAPLFSIYNTNKLDEYFKALGFDKMAIVHLQLLYLHKKALNENYSGKYVEKRVERVKNHKCEA